MHFNDFLKGARYGHREGCYSCFIGPLRTHDTCIADATYTSSLRGVKPCLYEASRSWLTGLNFRATMTSQQGTSDLTDWPWHIAARHFYLALTLPLRPFDVGRECKINVSACERYTINCGVPSIQNAQIDLAKVASSIVCWCFVVSSIVCWCFVVSSIVCWCFVVSSIVCWFCG